VKGTKIVDEKGAEVVLRGVNYVGYTSNPTPRTHTQGNYWVLRQLGFNVVRLPISWDVLEPKIGGFRIDYLAKYVSQDIQYAKQFGIYIVLDMHQYWWAKRFGGTGAPEWTVKQYPPNSNGMKQAVSNFWVNNTLQGHFAILWQKIAQLYANEPTIAGYDILNEPWIYQSESAQVNASHVDQFYMKIIKAIRQVDQKHMIFLEPANANNVNLSFGDNLVWSPHFYQLSFEPKYYPQNATFLETVITSLYKTYVTGGKRPIWIGEFGAFMTDDSANVWLLDATRLFAKFGVGWAWWAYDGRGLPSIPTFLSQNPS